MKQSWTEPQATEESTSRTNAQRHELFKSNSLLNISNSNKTDESLNVNPPATSQDITRTPSASSNQPNLLSTSHTSFNNVLGCDQPNSSNGHVSSLSYEW
ncbi:hypothetical protein I4U23_007209 [Adineta vaga]|nr:hypothetical protein I4U23_007209 [Adineta vaga]